ncbi:hypothetical protein RND71_011617 [Anisodus tanguticus]|uniref:Uncharacterized protein n=1 Tax=Anisodus tanguticus TaxID=243964 RepID=A0AAE1VPZ6_9SOLA|nr:hypothetical protein RND71_011617 [Anisodus tanguticus]
MSMYSVRESDFVNINITLRDVISLHLDNLIFVTLKSTDSCVSKTVGGKVTFERVDPISWWQASSLEYQEKRERELLELLERLTRLSSQHSAITTFRHCHYRRSILRRYHYYYPVTASRRCHHRQFPRTVTVAAGFLSSHQQSVRPPIFNDLNTRVPYVGGFVSSHMHNLLSE